MIARLRHVHPPSAAVPGPGGRRASSNALVNISLVRLDSRVSELALPVSESETGRHPQADRYSKAPGTARSISGVSGPVSQRLSRRRSERCSDFRVNAARLRACSATQHALICLSPAIALSLCISHDFTITANAGHLAHWARTSVRHSPLWQSDGLTLFSQVALKRLESDVTSVCIIMQVRRRTGSDRRSLPDA